MKCFACGTEPTGEPWTCECGGTRLSKDAMSSEKPTVGAGKSSPAPDGSAVWVVFRWQPDGHHEFQGVFGSEARAVEACRTDTHCVCPATVGVELGQDTETWPGAWYPRRETKIARMLRGGGG